MVQYDRGGETSEKVLFGTGRADTTTESFEALKKISTSNQGDDEKWEDFFAKTEQNSDAIETLRKHIVKASSHEDVRPYVRFIRGLDRAQDAVPQHIKDFRRMNDFLCYVDIGTAMDRVSELMGEGKTPHEGLSILLSQEEISLNDFLKLIDRANSHDRFLAKRQSERGRTSAFFGQDLKDFQDLLGIDNLRNFLHGNTDLPMDKLESVLNWIDFFYVHGQNEDKKFVSDPKEINIRKKLRNKNLNNLTQLYCGIMGLNTADGDQIRRENKTLFNKVNTYIVKGMLADKKNEGSLGIISSLDSRDRDLVIKMAREITNDSGDQRKLDDLEAYIQDAHAQLKNIAKRKK